MVRAALLALASVLFLLPGNFVAEALQDAAPACMGQGCGCPAPEESAPAWTVACCCQALPAPAPESEPNLPLQTPKESLRSDFAPASVATAVPGSDSVSDRGVERPAYLAHGPPDPLFLRHHVLRL